MDLSGKDKLGIAVGLGVAVIFAAIFVARAIDENQPRPDQISNCVGRPEGSTVILIDRSDELALQTDEEVIARALRYIDENVRINERVSIFTVNELSQKKFSAAFSKCKPASQRNVITEGVNVEKRFVRNFQQPLEQGMRLAGNSSGVSPIAQSITDLSLKVEMSGKRNALIVFSDMMENTPGFSLYKCSDSGSAIKTFQAARTGHTERPLFKNTSIIINVIPRDSLTSANRTCRDEFWSWYFQDSTSKNSHLSINPLPG